MGEPATPPTNLRLASDEVSDALAHALRFNGRKRYGTADEMQSRITADHLLKCLEMSVFVLMRKPPTRVHCGADLGLKPVRPYPADRLSNAGQSDSSTWTVMVLAGFVQVRSACTS